MKKSDKSSRDKAVAAATAAIAGREKTKGPDQPPGPENLHSQIIGLTNQVQVLQRTANNVADQRNRALNEVAQVGAEAAILAEQLQNVRTALEAKSKEANAASAELATTKRELEELQVAFLELKNEHDELVSQVEVPLVPENDSETDDDDEDDVIDDEYDEDETEDDGLDEVRVPVA